MATTNFNLLHMRFASRINDPVATAGTAGLIYSVTERDRYLNQASNFLYSWLWKLNPSKARELLQSIVKDSSAITLSNTGATITTYASDYNDMPLSFSKASDTNIFSYWPNKEDLDNNINPNLTNAYTIQGGKIYVYQSGTCLNTGTGTLKYISKDESAAVTGAGGTDIAISSKFWDVIVDIAVTFALEEVGQTSNTEAYAQRISMVVRVMMEN